MVAKIPILTLHALAQTDNRQTTDRRHTKGLTLTVGRKYFQLFE